MSEPKLSLSPGVSDIRTGSLPDLPGRTRYSFDGNINAPFDYFKSKTAVHNLASISGLVLFQLFDMVVEVSRDGGVIRFIENNHLSMPCALVSGMIVSPAQLGALYINGPQRYSCNNLSDILKMNRSLFASREENMRIVAALREFKAKVEADIESSNDNKGNKTHSYAQRINQPNTLNFTLNTPIITGDGPVKFLVEINYDVRDKAIEFWLESVEMRELFDTRKAELMDAEIAKFKEAQVPVIER